MTTSGLFRQDQAHSRFSPSDAGAITAQPASVLRLTPSTISLAHGSTELITWIDRLPAGSGVAGPIPASGRRTDQPVETGKRADMFPLEEADGFDKHRGSRAAVLRNPRREVIRLMDAPDVIVLESLGENFGPHGIRQFPELTVYPSQANFLLVKLPASVDGGGHPAAAFELVSHAREPERSIS